MEMIPGFLFGFSVGLPVAIIGKNMGNLFQVLLARTLLWNWAQRNIVQKYENCKIAQHMIQRGGFKSLIIFRSISVPLYIKNFGLGAMKIPVSNILLACFLSGLPFAVVWTFLGTKAKGIVQILNGEKPSLGMPDWMNWAVPLALVPIIFFLFRHIKTEWALAKEEIREEERKRKKVVEVVDVTKKRTE